MRKLFIAIIIAVAVILAGLILLPLTQQLHYGTPVARPVNSK